MKRYLSVFLAVLLTAAFSCGALADYDPATAAFTAYDTGSSDVEFNPAAGTYADYVQLNGQQGFAIFGSDGTLLSDACYPTMQYCGSDEPYYVVASEGDDVANRWGLVDGYTGQLSVPTQYFTIAYLSDRWQVGVVVTEGSESSYDFRTSQDDGYVYYSADHFDVYYGGALVGTLERDAVDAGDPSYSANAYGDYLYVEDREGKLRCFDKTLTASAYPSEFGEGSYSEYTWEGVHKGSNQQAFAPDCTLTPDEVGNPYLTDGGILYDLQGNMVLRAPSGIYLREYEMSRWAEICGYPLFPKDLCGVGENLKRKEIKALMTQWDKEFDSRIYNLFMSTTRVAASQLADKTLYDFTHFCRIADCNAAHETDD